MKSYLACVIATNLASYLPNTASYRELKLLGKT